MERFAPYFLVIVFISRKQRGDMEHKFIAVPTREDRALPSKIMMRVQTPTKASETLQLHLVTNKFQEIFKIRRVICVGEELLFGRLSIFNEK